MRCALHAAQVVLPCSRIVRAEGRSNRVPVLSRTELELMLASQAAAAVIMVPPVSAAFQREIEELCQQIGVDCQPLASLYSLVELVQHASDVGLYTNLITSAVLLTREKRAQLADAGLGDRLRPGRVEGPGTRLRRRGGSRHRVEGIHGEHRLRLRGRRADR